MDCSTPGFPVHHQLPELAKTHVHWVGDAIQPSHSLSSPSPLAFNLSQHQDLFQWVSSWHLVASVGVSASASVLPVNRQDWFPLGLTGLISLLSEGRSRVFSRPTVGKHQFFTSGGQKYWSFSSSISLSNEYSGLISFRTDWFYLLAVIGMRVPMQMIPS